MATGLEILLASSVVCPIYAISESKRSGFHLFFHLQWLTLATMSPIIATSIRYSVRLLNLTVLSQLPTRSGLKSSLTSSRTTPRISIPGLSKVEDHASIPGAIGTSGATQSRTVHRQATG